MASHGHLPEFSGQATDWDVFVEQLTFYCVANGIDDTDKKRAVLLSACGTPTYKLLKALAAPAELSTKSFKDLVKLAGEHYNPKPSVIMRRFRFNTCVRQEGETVNHFVTRLRDLASHCEYGDSAKELMRDRLVCGVRDAQLQRTLLAVAKLTYEKAYELAVLHEVAAQDSRLLSGPSTPLTPVNFTEPSVSTDDPSRGRCYHCGGPHDSKVCRYKDTVCNFCRKKGHLQRVCHRRLRQSKSKPPRNKPRPTNNIGEDMAASASAPSLVTGNLQQF